MGSNRFFFSYIAIYNKIKWKYIVEISFFVLCCWFFSHPDFFLSHTIGTQNLAMVMPSLCSLLPSLDGAVWSHDLSWLASWISTVFVVVVAAIVVVVVCATAAVVLSPWTEKNGWKSIENWFLVTGLGLIRSWVNPRSSHILVTLFKVFCHLLWSP